MKAAKKQKKIFKPHYVLLMGLLVFFMFLPSSFPRNHNSSELYSHYLKGLLAVEREDYDLALRELRKAKNKDPYSVQVSLKEATVLVRTSKLKEAEVVLKKTRADNPNNLDVYLALVLVYSYAQDDQKLEQSYEQFLQKAHELKPKDIGVSEYLAQFYFYKKKPQEAIEIYEKILKSNPEYIEALFWLGYFYEQTGREEEAIGSWQQALVKDPLCAPVLNSLGYVYAEKGVNLEEAEVMVKKALEKEPSNGAYLDSLGWIYFKKGDYAQAKEYLVKAIMLIKDPDIYEHLGELCMKMNNLSEGLSYYQKGLAEFPNDDGLKLKIEEYDKKNSTSKK